MDTGTQRTDVSPSSPSSGGVLEGHSGEGNGNPLQYSCPENLMDRGAWWAIVHRVAESDTAEVIYHVHTCTTKQQFTEESLPF